MHRLESSTCTADQASEPWLTGQRASFRTARMRACLSSLPYNIRAFPTATLPHSAKVWNRNSRISKPMLNHLTHEKWVVLRPLHQLVPSRSGGLPRSLGDVRYWPKADMT